VGRLGRSFTWRHQDSNEEPIHVPRLILHLSLVLIVAPASTLFAAIDYSAIGSTYSQNFNSLAATGTDHDWANDSTLPGWYLFRVTSGTNSTPVPMAFYDASDGSATNGRFYSFGANSDRALGGIGSGAFGYPGDRATTLAANQSAGWIAASITNSTGTPLTKFTLAYDGEQWSDAGDNEPPYAQTMQFEYGVGTNFSTVSSWTAPGGIFNFTSPVFTTTAGPVDGNAAGRVAGLGGTITDLSWLPGTTLWLRWVERNDSGLDHALAIDNLSFSAGLSAVPEASALAFGSLLCGLMTLAVGVRALALRRFSATAKK
jgi:hypothetical protein